MREIEALLNRINDLDWGRWPFLHLRPRPDEKMTFELMATMAAVFGPIGGLVMDGLFLGIGSALAGPPGARDAVWILLFFIVLVTAMFLPMYAATFGLSWNRRAHRLQTCPDPEDRPLLGEPFAPKSVELYGLWVPRGPLRHSGRRQASDG